MAETRNKVVNFRLSEDEYKELKSIADLNSMSVSDFVRNIVKDALDHPDGTTARVVMGMFAKISKQQHKILVALNRVGRSEKIRKPAKASARDPA